jgi:hypothetical protein
MLTIFFSDFKRAGQKVEAFYILYRYGDFTMYFLRAGQKVEGFYILYRYGDFTMYFLSRSLAVRERNAGDCEKRRDCITEIMYGKRT